MAFNFFLSLFHLSVPENLEMPIIPKTLNISDLKIPIAKSINLHTIRKPFEYPLESIM